MQASRAHKARLILATVLGLAVISPSRADENITYTYDLRGRLIKVVRSGSINNGVQTTYVYDKADNRTAVTLGAGGPTERYWEAESLSHQIGYADADGWSATPGTAAQALVYGPYYPDTPVGNFDAVFRVLTDNLVSSSGVVVYVDVWDATAGEAVASRSIRLEDFVTPATYRDFTVPFTWGSQRAGHLLELRIFYNSIAFARADRVGYKLPAADTSPKMLLNAGQSLLSEDRRFNLAMQTDGNLVLYGPSGALWWTGTNGGSDRRAIMQQDGNLVVYNGTGQALWNSATSGNPNAKLVLQNDGNLVIYSAGGAALWSSSASSPVPSFAINDVGITEGGQLAFTVTKTGSTTGTFGVSFATSNGTATAGSDYNAASGSLSFAAADTSKTITVATIDDAAVEPTETLNVTLSSPTGGATITRNVGVGSITDNDVAGSPCSEVSFGVNDVGVIEGDPLIFTVTRSGMTSSSCSVNYATADGTAVANTGYVPTSGTLTFAAGQGSASVTVNTVYQGRRAITRTMYLNLSAASGGAGIYDAQGIGSITGDGTTVCTTRCTQ